MCAHGPVACRGTCAHVREYGCVCVRAVWRADGPCPTLGTPPQARHGIHTVGGTRLTLEAVELDPVPAMRPGCGSRRPTRRMT